MRYAGLIKNDFSAAPGVSVTFFTQGCPHHCYGCHNPETWDFQGGKEFTPNILEEIVEALTANGINRSLCIMGGEPLCQENLFLTNLIVKYVRDKLDNILIYVWTGYTYEEILNIHDAHLTNIMNEIDYLIDGPFIQELKDLTLPMRGSSNQTIIKIDKSKKI